MNTNMRFALMISMCLSVFACEKRVEQKEDISAAPKDAQFSWVYIDDGAIQCESSGLPLHKSAERLARAGVQVKSSSCGHISGMATMTLCGTKTLGVHLHEIPIKDLKKAQSLGFIEKGHVDHGGQKKLVSTACEPG